MSLELNLRKDESLSNHIHIGNKVKTEKQQEDLQVKLSITETYVSHWGWWQGVRELLQNAVDTKHYHVEFADNTMTIVSHGGKIPTSALLLGKTTKANDNSTIGKFGEGMKLGFLVLKRLGATVTMNNAGDLWTPEMVYDEMFEENVLAVNITPSALTSGPDTVQIVIEGIPEEAIEEVRSKFAPLQNRTIVIENYRGKAYAKVDNRKNCQLFVNGIFVTEVPGKFKFDYDFLAEAFVLDRDRDSASTFEVKYEAARLIQGSDDIVLLSELATEYYDDLTEFRGTFNKHVRRSGHYEEGDECINPLTDAAGQLFRKKNGENAFPIDTTWEPKKKRVATQQIIKSGYIPIEVNHALFTMLEEDYQVDENLDTMLDFDPITFLEKFLAKHRRKMYSKAIRELENTLEVLKAIRG